MGWKDWIPLVAPVVGFFGALLGAWLGSHLSARNERAKLLRELRLKAAADLLTSTAEVLRWGDSAHRFQSREHADHRNRAFTEAWDAYNRVRLLGPKAVADVAQEFWEFFDDLAKRTPQGVQDEDFGRFRGETERFCNAISDKLAE